MESQHPARQKLNTESRPSHPVLNLNAEFDRITSGWLVNERAIESWLEQLQTTVSANDPCYWLLMARLTELAIVCAGRYADACEFAAAGDLLVNPREIRVHVSGRRPTAVVKQRRGALTAQFAGTQEVRESLIRWFRLRTTLIWKSY